jgi:hypothetical protein
MTRTIQIVNKSTVVKDADFKAAVSACGRQVSEHFGPAWGVFCFLAIVPEPNPAVETIIIMDDSDQAGALGYHEVDAADAPTGYVFAKTCLADGSPWQSCFSHELLEQLADPFAATCAVVPFLGQKIAAVEYEVCDPVEEDTYAIDGVPVSNFVLPTWFQDPKNAKGPFDYLKKLTAPLTLTKGGYVGYSANLRTWHQTFADKHKLAKSRAAKPKYGRRGKRVYQAAS